MSSKKTTITLILAYIGFISIGLPDGLLGVAWPSVRESFHISLDDTGALLGAVAVGYLIASFNNGPVVARLGVGLVLTVSSLIVGVGLFGYALSPLWYAMIVAGFAVGVGSGAVDAGLNTYVATHYSPAVLNWLHASFGLGTALGPAIMTLILNGGMSWRWGYVLIGGSQLALAVCFGLTMNQWLKPGPSHQPPSSSAAGADTEPDTRHVLQLPVVWGSVLLFFIYAGAEVSVGQWAYTLFTESRSIKPVTAGIWVSIYWGVFTIGRLLAGVIANRLSPDMLLRFGMAGALCGSLLIWWNLTPFISLIALAFIGFSFAPVFPSLISSTPARVGANHTATVIGFQVGAASLGVALLPGLAGILAERMTLEVIGPFLVIVCLAMAAVHELVLLLSR